MFVVALRKNGVGNSYRFSLRDPPADTTANGYLISHLRIDWTCWTDFLVFAY